MKTKLLILSIGASLLLSSCSGYSTPTSLVKPPSIDNMAYGSSNKDLNSIVQKFLPNGSKLLDPNRAVSGKAVFTMDVDNDKSDEIVALFRIDSELENGIIVLKKENSGWVKILEKKMQSNSISKVELVNVINKNEKSLIVGYYIGGIAGSQYITYTFENKKVQEIDTGIWQKIEILNTPLQKNKGFVFASWTQDTGDVQTVDLYKIEGNKLLNDEEFYPSYLPKILEYYNGVLQKYGNLNQLAWYHIINAQIKGNVPNDALKSIDKVTEIKAKNDKVFKVEDYKFKFLKAQAFNKLKRYDESKIILDDLITQMEKEINKDKEINNDMLIMDKKIDISNMYLEKGKMYVLLNEKDKAKEMFNKALSISEEVCKDEGDNKTIYEDIIINNIKEQIEKLN